MAASDFLFSIGADPAAADEAVQAFVKRTNAALDSIHKVNIVSNAGVQQAIKNQATLLQTAEKRLAVEQKIADAQKRNASAGISGGGLTDISGIANRNATAIGKQRDAIDMLGRITGNAVFKFVEYELVMKAFNGAVSEMMNSLNEASNVQMEQVLQRIYNAQINTNVALKDAVVIAKEWGSDITDVQQAIGLWTKQTSQMHDATGKLVDSQTALAAAAKLAADAEKFHRASGVDSLEVYTKSISMWHELGISLGEIPGMYDKIAYAATKIARPLKAQPGKSGGEEGIKDIFDAVAESGATLKAQGMDESTIIATVAQQIENLGTQGSRAGTLISTMFGSLNQGGKPLKAWTDALGGEGAFKDADTFMEAAIMHVDQLKKAQVDGALRVKPNTMNTWRAFINTLQEVKDKADDIRKNSGKGGGMLEQISEAEMNTYNGQVERLKSSFQELNLALGTQLLPVATRVASVLSGTVLPAVAANAGGVGKFAMELLKLAGAYGFVLTATKGWAALSTFRVEAASAAAVAEQFGAAELSTVPGMEAAEAQMQREIAALERLKEQMAVVEWETGGLAAACAKLGISEAELATITETKVSGAFGAAGVAARNFGASIAATMGPIMAVYAAMQLLSSGAAVFDQGSNLTNTLNDTLLGKGTWQGRLQAGVNPLNLPGFVQNGLSALFGRDKLAQSQFENLAKSDPQLEKLYQEFKASHDTAHQDALRQEILLKAGQDYDSKHFQNVPGYNNLDHIPKWLQDIMNRAQGGTPAGMTLPGAAPGHGPHAATEQQVAAEAVNKDKADAMAQISHWRDIANAAASYTKTINEAAQANGYTEETVKRLAAAFKTQNDAIYNGQQATEKEIASLNKQKQSLDALIKSHKATIDAKGKVHGGDHTSALYAEAKAWRMADEAITKAKGNLALYNAEKAKLKQNQSTTMGEAEAWSQMAKIRLPGITQVTSTTRDFNGDKILGVGQSSITNPLASPASLKAYLESISDSLSGSTTAIGKVTNAGAAIQTIHDLTTQVHNLYAAAKNPRDLAAFSAALVQLKKVGTEATKDLGEGNKSVDEFNKNMTGLLGTLASKNSEDMGKLLGLDPGTVEAQKTLQDGYNSIDDSVQKIDEWVKSTAGTYNGLDDSQKRMVQNAIAYLNVQQQILPLLAQQEQIQNSIAYKATQETLEKHGQEVLDQTIARLMGNQNNAQTREALYKESISGTALSGMQSLFKDYLTNTVTQWWQQTVKNLTNSIFGDPADKARNLEANMLKQNRDGLTTILENTKTQVVQKLFDWETKFAATVDKMPGAGTGGGSTGSGSNGNNSNGVAGANGQTAGAGSNGNPVAVTPVDQTSGVQMGDKTTPLQVSQQAATEQGANGGQQSGAGAGSNQNDDYYGASAAGSPLTQSGFSLIQGLMGPFATALAPIMQKLQNTTGGQIAGNIIGGAAQGYAIGGMEQTSAGNSSDWGAVGGALGSAASMIPGVGPILGAILPAAGGFLGGLFGNHETAADEPDVYDTQNYGQFVSNMNGTVGTYNGVTIAAQPQYNIGDGAMSMGQQMYAWAQKNPNDPLAKQIIALGPKLGIVNEYQGVFTLGSGKTISVTAYEQLGQEWQAKATGATNSPIVSVNSYGGGSAAGPYNSPGMDSNTFISEEEGWASGMSGSTGYGSYNAPMSGGGSQGGGSGGSGGVNGDAIVGGMAGSSLGNTQLAPYSPTATPGYGGRGSYGTASGASLTQLKLQISTPVYLDGKLLTQIVNAYNAQSRSNKGGVGAGPIR